MNNQNTLAILAMCSIVITVYALRNSEAHYLPDLLGLALALAASRQIEALGAWCVVCAIRHTPVGFGLAGILPVWSVGLVLPAAAHMSIRQLESTLAESAYNERISEAETEPVKEEIPQRVAENTPENIHLLRVQIIADFVNSGEVGLTKAIQIGAGAKSGSKYQKFSRLVKAELDRRENHYPPGSNLNRFEP